MNKKMLTSTLSAMVLSGLITGTALAAQNPFLMFQKIVGHMMQ